ncbi:MAG: membrane dipeptidase [Gemmatimonadetes bacterium]|nr:membrane dipeptidase [Gemmatimonadota bacterium]
MSISRRHFVAASAVACLPDWSRLLAVPAPAWPGYDRATVIDCLASPGPFNSPLSGDGPLTAEMVENARKSGITAINVTVSSSSAGHVAFDDTIRRIAYWEREIAAHPDVFMQVRTVADIAEAKRSGRLGLIYGFQDAVMLEGDLARLTLFHRLGVKIVQLTYNLRNQLGDGSLEPGDAGLSQFGRSVVARMNELGMLVDLSHCGTRTTDDGIAASTKPVAITHSGCRAVFNHPRSKQDATLKALANRGGVIGIYMMPFINASGQPRAEHLIAQIEHALQVCGEDHVGIGSDLSITPHVADAEYDRLHKQFVASRQRLGIAAPREEDYMFVADMNSPRRMEMIADRLAARGHSAARIEKVIGANWVRLFRETWGTGAPA